MSKYWKFALAATALIATTAFAFAQMESDHDHTSRSGMVAGMPERMMQMHQRMMQSLREEERSRRGQSARDDARKCLLREGA